MNAARTMLYDIHQRSWSRELLELFNVDEDWLPQVVASSGDLGRTDAAAFAGIDAPIAGIGGDQQAALFGQACFTPGQAKATYGTGGFVLVNSGSNAPTTEALISTIGWQLGNDVTYALEGAVFTAGASIQWMRDGLKLIDAAPEIEPLAASVADSGSVTVVPAFAGLGAPHWDAHARGAILGLTRGSTNAHVARALLEASAFRIRDNVEAMRSEGTDVTELRVDGGMSHNNLFLQMQADALNLAVTRPANVETTSLGAAFLAGLGAGIWSSLDEVAATWKAERTFEPGDTAWVEPAYRRFSEAVTATRRFARAISTPEPTPV